MPLFGCAAYAAPNKGTTILYWFRYPKTVLNPPVNGKIQELFKDFECFSSSFQGKFNFQGLSKTNLYIQVLFKPVPTIVINCGIRLNLLDNLSCFLSSADIFFKINFFKKFFHEYHQSGKQCVSRSGRSFCPAWFGSNLIVKVISRRH